MSTIVNCDHETHDLSQYDYTVIDSGDLSVEHAAALAGTAHGLQCVLDDTTAIYAECNTINNTSGTLRCRFYIDPNTLTMANLDAFVVLGTYGTGNLVLIWLKYSSAYKIYAQVFYDGANTSTSEYTITDAAHFIEFRFVKATTDVSSNGSFQLWIDGESKQTISSLDNYDQFDKFDKVEMGAYGGIDAGTSGTFYLDELIVNDSDGEIGPVSSGKKKIGINQAWFVNQR